MRDLVGFQEKLEWSLIIVQIFVPLGMAWIHGIKVIQNDLNVPHGKNMNFHVYLVYVMRNYIIG